jgi:hypothetical protein
LADRTDLLAQRGAEHHHLFFTRCVAENLLYISKNVLMKKYELILHFKLTK